MAKELDNLVNSKRKERAGPLERGHFKPKYATTPNPPPPTPNTSLNRSSGDERNSHVPLSPEEDQLFRSLMRTRRDKRVSFGDITCRFINPDSPPMSAGPQNPRRSGQPEASGSGSGRRPVQERLTAQAPPSGVPDASGTLDVLADNLLDVSLDEGVHRIIVTPSNGAEMTERQSEEVRASIEKLIDRLLANVEEFPINIDKWNHQNGRLVLTPGGPDALEDGERLIQMINDTIKLQGRRVRAQWNHNLERVADLTIKFSGSGVPVELIEDPVFGLVRMNRWPAELRKKVRFLQLVSAAEDEEEGQAPSRYRIIRFEAHPEVVRLIQERDGSIYIGKDKGTVKSNKKPLTKGAQVLYKLQK